MRRFQQRAHETTRRAHAYASKERAALRAGLMERRRSIVALRRGSVVQVDAEPEEAIPSLPNEWVAALASAVQPAADKDIELGKLLRDNLLKAVGTLHAREEEAHEASIEAQREKRRHHQEEVEKKMESLRRAGGVEQQGFFAQLEASQQAVEQMQVELEVVRAECEAKLAQAAANEKKLMWKISSLDGGIAAAELERERYIQQIGEKAVRRMRNAELAGSFESWLEMWEEKRRMKAVAGRFLNLAVSRAWSTWLEMADEAAITSRRLAAAGARLMKPALAASLAHWKADWEYARQVAEQGGLLGRIAMLEDALLQARQSTNELVQAAEAAAAAAANQQRIEEMAGRSVRRMMSVGLTRGWQTWVEKWEHRVHVRRLLALAVGRLAQPKLVFSLVHWKQDWEVEEREAILRNATTVEGKMQARIAQLEQALRQSREISSSMQNAVDAEKAEASQRRIEDMAKKSVRRMLSQRLARGFEAWVEQWEETLQKKRVLQGFIKRLMNAELSRGWGAWLEQWEDMVVTKRMLAAAVSRLQAPAKSAMFRHWYDDWIAARLKARPAAEVEAERLEAELADTEKAKAALEAEAKERAELLAQQAAEIEAMRHERELIRKEANARLDRERTRREALKSQLEETELRLSKEQSKTDELEQTGKRLLTKLNAREAPMKVQEKAALVAAMNARMSSLAKEFALRSSGSSGSSGGLGSARGTQSTPRLVPQPQRDAVHQALMDLAITPSNAEAHAWRQHVKISDEISVLLKPKR